MATLNKNSSNRNSSGRNKITTSTAKIITRDTKSQQRFLDAAESLFGDYGYEGAKIRAIAELSKVNLGALHHYWGSKEELFSAVCQRRFLPMNQERMRRFDDLVKQSSNSNGLPIDIRALFRASIEPTFFLNDLTKDEHNIFRKFYGRAISEPSHVVGKVMKEIFTPISIHFFALLQQLCPHLTNDEFYWRSNCIYGAYLYAPAFSDRIALYAHKEFDPTNIELGIAQMVEFLVAGILAPSTINPKLVMT